MEKVKLTVQDVRNAVNYMHDAELSEIVSEYSDDKLAEANLMSDLQMDSLDIIEMTLEIEQARSVCIPDEAYEKIRYSGGSVQAMLDIYNEFI